MAQVSQEITYEVIEIPTEGYTLSRGIYPNQLSAFQRAESLCDNFNETTWESPERGVWILSGSIPALRVIKHIDTSGCP